MERLCLDRFASPWLRNQHIARYEWALDFARGGSVLDAACGSGYGSRILLDRGARSVTSLDLSSEAARDARRAGWTLSFARADVSRLPFSSATFELYTCFETIEHVPDDRALVAEARRVLKPGGTFLCSTPNRELLSPGHRLEDAPENPYHVREYSCSEFESLLRTEFPTVTLWAQTLFSARHRAWLRRAGVRSNRLAIRLHQVRNLIGLPWERAARHIPTPYDPKSHGDAAKTQVPEVFVAVCASS